MRFPAENAFECGAKLGAKYGVDDWVKGGIEVSKPQKEADQMLVEVNTLENGY